MVVRRRLFNPVWLLLLLHATWGSELSPSCTDEASCQAHLQNLTERLQAMRTEMQGKHLTLQALEELRTGILTGRRIELPSAQRQHLEKGSPLINEISFDARHRPVSTNVTRHFQRIRTLAPDAEVRLHTFMPLKRASSSRKGGPSALLVTVDIDSKLSIHNLEGDTLLDKFDPGHGPNRRITLLTLSPNQDNHFVLTADDEGQMRVHSFKVIAKKEKKEKIEEDVGENQGDKKEDKKGKKHGDKQEQNKKQLVVTTNFSCAFSVPPSASGEVRKLNAVLPIERGSQTYFVTADSLGGIAVFYRNGTMKGRVRVTEDPQGVRGLLRSQGQMILFYSSHSFGFFSVAQIDVQYPPCSGWNAPLFDVVLDPSYSSSRVVLALADGDVLVFSTSRGKSKACDLTLKFPHVSAIPFKLNVFRGHIMALPTLLEDTPRKTDYLREIYFFNLAAMDAGYGVAPSRSVTLQASFKPKQPEDFALYGAPSTSSGDRKSQIAIRFAGTPGVELYDLTLKQPPAPKSVSEEEEGWPSNWLNWFPKIGLFGIALIGVVIWNVRKVTNQRRHDHMDEFDDDFIKERLKERREKTGGKTGLSDDDVLGAAGLGQRSKIEEIGGDNDY